jgi:hypothetical protein
VNAATQLLPAPILAPGGVDNDGAEADGSSPSTSARPCVAPPAPPRWRPEGLVLAALTRLKVRCDGDRHETAWRCGILFCQQWGFPGERFMRAWQSLAEALSGGDDAAATAAASIIVATPRPGEGSSL